MGLLVVDHSACIDPATGQAGKKLEFDTIACCHCQAVIKIVLRDVPGVHTTRYRCARCKRAICRFCAEVKAGVCDPIGAKVDRALRGGSMDFAPYEYKILPNK